MKCELSTCPKLTTKTKSRVNISTWRYEMIKCSFILIYTHAIRYIHSIFYYQNYGVVYINTIPWLWEFVAVPCVNTVYYVWGSFHVMWSDWMTSDTLVWSQTVRPDFVAHHVSPNVHTFQKHMHPMTFWRIWTHMGYQTILTCSRWPPVFSEFAKTDRWRYSVPLPVKATLDNTSSKHQ